MKKVRVGESILNKRGLKMTIVEYFSATNISIEFSDGTIVREREYGKFKIGSIENPMSPLLLSIGFMGQGRFNSKHFSHQRWQDMIKRCYESKKANLNYADCTVHKDWHNFQNFAKWVEKNYIKNWDLDKDILVSGNKIYGPNTCCFVPPIINQYFKREHKRQTLPSGIRFFNMKFFSYLDRSRKFHSKEEAEIFHNYLRKSKIAEIAETYKKDLPHKVYERLTEVKRGKIFSIDFDATCVAYRNPGIGADIGAVTVLKELIEAGHKIVLSTVRSNKDNGLLDSIKWFQDNKIELYGVQFNPLQSFFTDSPKVYSDYLIDDTALGVPLTSDSNISDKPFVDWIKVRQMLVDKGLI